MKTALTRCLFRSREWANDGGIRLDPWVAGMATALTASACWTDLRTMKIPNLLTAGFALAGLFYHLFAEGAHGLVSAAAGGAAGALPLWLLYRCGGMGAGDVKWFGAFGIWAGAAAALQLAVYAILAAGGIGALLLATRLPGLRNWSARLPWPWGRHPGLPGKGAAFPFMLAVAPAFVFLMGGGWGHG